MFFHHFVDVLPSLRHGLRADCCFTNFNRAQRLTFNLTSKILLHSVEDDCVHDTHDADQWSREEFMNIFLQILDSFGHVLDVIQSHGQTNCVASSS